MSFLNQIKQSLHVYRHNFLKLFIPLFILQLIVFLLVLFFTVSGILNAVQSAINAVIVTAYKVSDIVIVLGVVVICCIFAAPLIIAVVANVVGRDYRGGVVEKSLKTALLFWYAFSYNSYMGEKLDYDKKRGIKTYESSSKCNWNGQTGNNSQSGNVLV